MGCTAVTLAMLWLMSGCASTSKRTEAGDNQSANAKGASAGQADKAKEDEKAKEEKKKAEKERNERAMRKAKLTRELEIAQREVKRVASATEDQKATSKENVDKSTLERDLAVRRLKEFDEKHSVVRLDRSKLDLQGTRDYVKESEEELAQLEMMYKDNDLADKTREIVIERAKRRLERARRSLEIQQREGDNLEKATIPVEREDLRIQLLQREQSLEQTKRQAEAEMRSKAIEMMRSEAEVARIEADLVQVDREEKDAKP